MRKLALVGYGKMGQIIDRLAPQQGFEVVQRLTSANNEAASSLTPEKLSGVDAAIEFSTPEAAIPNLHALAKARIPTVTGTTGWSSQLPEISALYSEAGTALVWSPNFSVGVAVFRRLVATAATLLRDETEFGSWAWEIHHDAKKDSPSGTLLQMVQTMRDSGYARDISVSANRAGRHPGIHEIGFDSSADTLTIRHTARNREGFALGALKSAEWVIGKSGVFTFEDVLFGKER